MIQRKIYYNTIQQKIFDDNADDDNLSLILHLCINVMISLIHSLIRAQVKNNGCLDYLLLDKKVRPNSLFFNATFIFMNEVYSVGLYYL